MSMNTHVIGIINATEEFEKMLNVARACKEANIETPNEVYEYFGWKLPSFSNAIRAGGMEINLQEYCQDYHEDMIEGKILYLKRIPEGVYAIKFVNSY